MNYIFFIYFVHFRKHTHTHTHTKTQIKTNTQIKIKIKRERGEKHDTRHNTLHSKGSKSFSFFFKKKITIKTTPPPPPFFFLSLYTCIFSPFHKKKEPLKANKRQKEDNESKKMIYVYIMSFFFV